MTDRHITPELTRQLLIDATPWLSCDDCFSVVDEYLERIVADPDYRDPAMSAHLRGCKACAEEATSLFELMAHDAGIDAGPLLQRITAR